MAEASDILTARDIVHAAIDMDALGTAHLPSNPGDASSGARASFGVAYRNLTTVWANYSAAGVDRLLLASAVERQAELDQIRAALPPADIVICRLIAPLETMQQRVVVREPGMLQQQFVARVAELDRILDSARVEDFCIHNADRSVTDVAHEALTRAGWLRS